MVTPKFKKTKALLSRMKKINVPGLSLSKNKLSNRYIFDYTYDESCGLAVIVHLFYPDLWEDILNKLNEIKQPFDLYISVAEDDINLKHNNEYIRQINIIKFPNRGRDVLPFLMILISIRSLNHYEYILKIHTKKSKHRKDGSNWFNEILNELLPKDTQAIFDILAKKDTGLVGPDEQIVSLSKYIGENTNGMKMLISKMFGQKKALKILDNQERNPFFGGTMFWARIDFFDHLFLLDLKPTDFPEEAGQVDGTIAHAFERVIGMAMHRLNGRKMYSVNRNGVIKKLEDKDYIDSYKYV